MVSRVSRFWREFFDPEGVVILVSCSSGSLDGGIAEELSKTLPNATIYASKEDAYLEDIIDQDGHLVPLFLAPDD